MLLGVDNVKDYEKSISFGVSFIFTFFLSGLAGYYLGKFYLEYSEIKVIFIFFLNKNYQTKLY